MKRDALIFAICLCIGIFLSSKIPSAVFISVLTVGFLLVIKRFVLKGKIQTLALIICVGVLLGEGLYTVTFEEKSTLVNKYAQKNFTVTGKVVSNVECNDKISFTVSAEKIGGEEVKNVKIKCSIKNLDTIPKYGDLVTVNGYIYEPYDKNNFGEFDYRQYLFARKIYLSMSSKEPVKTEGSKISYLNPVDIASIIRERTTKRMDEKFSDDTLGLVKAMITGDKSSVSDTLDLTLKRAGLSHVASVSGLHISMFLSFVMLLSYFFIGNTKRGRVIYIISILFFILFTGASPSVVRAGIMCILCQGAQLVIRRNDSITSLSIAVILILLFSPGYLFDIGFILSVSATLGIILLAGNITGRFDRKKRFLIETVAVTFSAQLFSFPPLVSAFNCFSAVSIVSNVAVSLIIPVCMIFGYLFCIFSYIPYLCDVSAFLTKAVFNILICIAKAFSGIPFSLVRVGEKDVFFITAFYALCLFLYLIIAKKENFYKMLALAVAVSSICTGMMVHALEKDCMYIEFINVSHGDSALIRTPDNKSILIDAGGSYDYDTGKTVMDYLTYRGIKKVDYAFVSHYHQDHAQGLFTLISENMVKNLIIPKNVSADNQLKEKLLNLCKEKGTKVFYFQRGNMLHLKSGVNLRMIAPELSRASFSDTNETSMVLRLDYGDVSAIFTGDIEQDAENRLCRIAENLKCDILKVAHHGSKTSSGIEFLKEAQPRYAVVSSEKTVEELDEEVVKNFSFVHSKMYSTAQSGTVVFKVNKKKIESVFVSRKRASNVVQ